jgi:hypothetical protein
MRRNGNAKVWLPVRRLGSGHMGQDDVETRWWQYMAGLLLVAAVVSGLYGLVAAVDPGTVQAKADAGFFDLLISNRTVLAILRVA